MGVYQVGPGPLQCPDADVRGHPLEADPSTRTGQLCEEGMNGKTECVVCTMVVLKEELEGSASVGEEEN